jgi:hypothetical protein
VHVTSQAAGFARADHYLKFTGGAHLQGEGRDITADEATIFLSEDQQRMQRMELRTNARITSQPGSGTSDMRARDIDLIYGEDGRALQAAHLVEGASVQLPGTAGAGGRQVSARTIDIGMAPDGDPERAGGPARQRRHAGAPHPLGGAHRLG